MEPESAVRPAARSRAVFVHGVWALMLLGAVLYVARYAHNVPYYDGWSMVEVLDGRQPVDAAWLWQPRNEHRVPVPKLILLSLYTVGGWDFRAGMYFNVLLLGALAAAMIRIAARQRGFVSSADAFFPVALLHWGHYENLLWSWQVTQVVPIAIAGALLLVMVRSGTRPTPRNAVVSATAVAALPLCGIAGVVTVPGFALWLAAVGWHLWVAGMRRSRVAALAVWGLATLAIVLIPLYFVGLHSNARPSFELWAVAKTVVKFVAHGLGPAALVFHPIVALLVAAMMVAAVVALLGALRRAPGDGRLWALLLFLAAFAGLALSVGVGRTGAAAFPNRYALFAVPALCWIYLTGDRCTRPVLAHAGRAGLFLLVVALSVVNFRQGLDYARARDRALTAMENDIRAGHAPAQIIATHQRTLLPFPGDGGAYLHDRFGDWLGALRAEGVGAFAELVPGAAYREIPLEEAAANTMATSDAEGAAMTWTLAPGTFVHGLRVLRPADAGSGGTAPPTTLHWRRDEREPFANTRRGIHWWELGQPSATFWICDRILEVRMRAERADRLRDRARVLLLMPEEGADRASVPRPRAGDVGTGEGEASRCA